MLAQPINTRIILTSKRGSTNTNLKTEHTDMVIIKEVLSGSKNAFKELYSKYARNHFLTCLRYIKDKSTAEDLLQESYLNIYKNLKQFKPELSKFSTWSNKVVINTCLMYLRRNDIFNKPDNIYDAQTVTYNLVHQPKAIEQLSLQELTKLIQCLPNGYKMVFNLYVVDGYSHKEIAEMLKISISTSKTQLLKAKKTLQKYMLTRDNSQPVK